MQAMHYGVSVEQTSIRCTAFTHLVFERNLLDQRHVEDLVKDST